MEQRKTQKGKEPKAAAGGFGEYAARFRKYAGGFDGTCSNTCYYSNERR